jgi:hypothetical protein
MIPPKGVSQNPDTTHITPRPTRSLLLKAALGYAEKGKPTLPCKPDKSPYTRHGFKDASTDPRRIHMWHSKWPGANIGMPTGERSGVWVLDLDLDRDKGIDGPAALEELPGEMPETLTVRTPRGGLHLYFRHVEGITNSPGGLPDGIDVRGQGGYVVLPPSAGYSWEHWAEVAEAPGWLLEMVREKPPARTSPRRSLPRPWVEGERIPEGSRNTRLTSLAGGLHDGTRDLARLTEELLTIRDERCENPETFTYAEVERIAEWIHRQEPCSPRETPERDELVRALERAWTEDPAKGVGGKTDSSIERVLLREGASVGTVVQGVGLRVSISVRDVAKKARCHVNTVLNYTRRASAAGRLRKDGSTRRGQSGAFILPDPRLRCDTLNNSLTHREREVVGVSQASRAPASELRTEHYRWRGLVGKGRERALCFLEAFGPLTAEELAARLGWARARDLRLRYLDPLTDLGLLELRGDAYAVPGDYRERQGEARREDYSTVQARIARVRSEEGLWVYVVKESGIVASEEKRDALACAQNERERDAFHRRSEQDTPEADEGCRELLTAWDRERESSEAEPAGEIWELERVEDPEPIRSEAEVFEIARAFAGRMSA